MLTSEQQAARRARQRATAAQPNCANCRNKAPMDDRLCRGCRDQADKEAIADNAVRCSVERIHDLLDNAGVLNARGLAEEVLQLVEAVLEREAAK